MTDAPIINKRILRLMQSHPEYVAARRATEAADKRLIAAKMAMSRAATSGDKGDIASAATEVSEACAARRHAHEEQQRVFNELARHHA